MSVEYYEGLAREKKRDTHLHNFEKDPTWHQNHICVECEVRVRDDVALWYNTGVKHGAEKKSSKKEKWTVWRQDDNGNKFMVAENLSQEEAANTTEMFGSKAHKQIYWAEPSEGIIGKSNGIP